MGISSKTARSPFFRCHFRSRNKINFFLKIFIFGGLPIRKPYLDPWGSKITILIFCPAAQHRIFKFLIFIKIFDQFVGCKRPKNQIFHDSRRTFLQNNRIWYIFLLIYVIIFYFQPDLDQNFHTFSQKIERSGQLCLVISCQLLGVKAISMIRAIVYVQTTII